MRGTSKELLRIIAVLTAVAMLGAVGCGSDDDDGTTTADVSDAGMTDTGSTNAARVVVTGKHGVEVGASITLSASTADGTDKSYGWKSADDKVATVDDTGKVTGVAAGETLITATGADTAAAGTHPVVVSEKAGAGAEAVVVVSGDYTVMVSGTTTLTAKTVNGTDSKYTWSSSDEAVATVDDKGVVYGKGSGKATITAEGADTMVKGMFGVLVATTVPYQDKWLKSGHADSTAEAFNHWNEPEEEGGTPEISASCAKCHSTPGYLDFIGADGSEADKIDKAAKIGTTVECQACHNPVTMTLDHVIFPSGVKVEGLGPEARCMTCHQGRASTDSVNAGIKKAQDAGLKDDDTSSKDLGFSNIHYYPAGATLNAGQVRGGYQYADKVYDWRFRHVPSHDSCVKCHDPHSLEVKLDTCKECHKKVDKVEDLHDIRMISSMHSDYDGDGDLTEGVYYEITGLRDLLIKSLQTYAADKGLDKICYSPSAYPYWFKDADGDGTCSETEAVYASAYKGWTARMVKAAYNYQLAKKDPGAFAHNAKYIIQLLYDGIEDLNAGLKTPVDMTKLTRNDPGHFNGAGEAARHWDEDEGISASCSKCHSGSEGFLFYLDYGVGKTVLEQDNGMDCATCHAKTGSAWDLVPVSSVTFPSGKTFTTTEKDKDGKDVPVAAASNLCMTCHSGRQSMASVEKAATSAKPSFQNMHYLPAGAVLKGGDADGLYEYAGKTYAGTFMHVSNKPGSNDCTYCHNPMTTKHTFDVKDNMAACTVCHSGIKSIEEIKMNSKEDYDGNGKVEHLTDELHGLADLVYAEILKTAKVKSALCYTTAAYPYWFKDTDGNGTCEASEAAYSNSYKDWTAAGVRAAHNYQTWKKDPGAWAHNFTFMAQVLIDTIADLGGDVSKLKRP